MRREARELADLLGPGRPDGLPLAVARRRSLRRRLGGSLGGLAGRRGSHGLLVVVDVGLALVLLLEVFVREVSVGQRSVVVLVLVARAQMHETVRRLVVVMGHVVMHVRVGQGRVVVLLETVMIRHRNFSRGVVSISSRVYPYGWQANPGMTPR